MIKKNKSMGKREGTQKEYADSVKACRENLKAAKMQNELMMA